MLFRELLERPVWTRDLSLAFSRSYTGLQTHDRSIMQIFIQPWCRLALTLRRRRLIFLTCALFITIPAGVASGGHDFQYSTGIWGVGGYHSTTGYDNRDYNRAWHQSGYKWHVFYLNDVGGFSCEVYGTINPTRCEADGAYRQSWCHNITDDSGVTWSCNSTHGFNHSPEASKGSPTFDRRIVPSPTFPISPLAGTVARKALTVFSRGRVPSDRLPVALATDARELTVQVAGLPEAIQPGAADPAQSRALLFGLGSESETFYAVPTAKDGVCLVLSSHGALGCVDRFSFAVPYVWDVRDPDQQGAGRPVIVDGLVPGSVVSVRIRVDGSFERASFGSGGFFYELKSSRDWPEAIEFRYADETTSIVQVSRPAPPSKN